MLFLNMDSGSQKRSLHVDYQQIDRACYPRIVGRDEGSPITIIVFSYCSQVISMGSIGDDLCGQSTPIGKL